VPAGAAGLAGRSRPASTGRVSSPVLTGLADMIATDFLRFSRKNGHDHG
jgi:hypothetical protein